MRSTSNFRSYPSKKPPCPSDPQPRPWSCLIKRRVTPWYRPCVGVQSAGSIERHSGTERASCRHHLSRSRRTSNSGCTGSRVSILATNHGERPARSILRPRHNLVRSFRKTEGGTRDVAAPCKACFQTLIVIRTMETRRWNPNGNPASLTSLTPEPFCYE